MKHVDTRNLMFWKHIVLKNIFGCWLPSQNDRVKISTDLLQKNEHLVVTGILGVGTSPRNIDESPFSCGALGYMCNMQIRCDSNKTSPTSWKSP